MSSDVIATTSALSALLARNCSSFEVFSLKADDGWGIDEGMNDGIDVAASAGAGGSDAVDDDEDNAFLPPTGLTIALFTNRP